MTKWYHDDLRDKSGDTFTINKPEPTFTYVIHDVRSWSYLYEEMIQGRKKHDLRRNDRNYKVGDKLLLIEFDQTRGVETGRRALFSITYITGRSTVPCAVSTAVLPDDFCILSVQLESVVVG
jgi:hypothetical protein